jgi:hypothetical protein
MLNVLRDGPFRYIHSAATGELIMTLERCSGGFIIYRPDGAGPSHSLREWKFIARRRMGNQLITDTDRQ